MVSLEDMLNVGVQQPQNLPAVMELAYRKGILAQPLKGVDAPELVAAAQSGDRGALLSGLFRLGYLTAETKRHTRNKPATTGGSSGMGIAFAGIGLAGGGGALFSLLHPVYSVSLTALDCSNFGRGSGV